MGFDIKKHRDVFMPSIVKIADLSDLQIMPMESTDVRSDWKSLTEFQRATAASVIALAHRQVAAFIESDSVEFREVLMDACLIDHNFGAVVRAEVVDRYNEYSLAGHEGLLKMSLWWLESVVFLARCLGLDISSSEPVIRQFTAMEAEWSAAEEVDYAISQILGTEE